MKNIRNKIGISLTALAFLWLLPILTANALSVAVPEPNCHISQGAKICTSCEPIYDILGTLKGVDNETEKKDSVAAGWSRRWKQCESCSETYKPLVEHKNCKTSNDCALVKADCCSGPCRPLAIHKAQVGKYNARLKEECYGGGYYKSGGTGGIGTTGVVGPQCVCGELSRNYKPRYAAVCRLHIQAKQKRKDSSSYKWNADKKHKQKYCAVLEYLAVPKPPPSESADDSGVVK